MVLTHIHEFFHDWVRPRAGELDQNPQALREALREMGRRGLLGLRIPQSDGGLGLEALECRRVQELSARSSGALAFLESQHQSACALVVRSSNQALRSRLLPRLAHGEDTSGIAFSHLRHHGPSLARALPCSGGFQLEGRLPWVTGWDLFTLCVTAAPLPDRRILFAVHPLKTSPSLRASLPLPLAAMGVTQTVEVEFENFFIPEGDVLGIHPESWIRDNDRIAVALQSPLALGCAEAAVDLLRDESRKKASVSMGQAADRLGRELAECRKEAYDSMEEGSPVERRLRARAAAIEIAGRAAHAAVIASAGAGNLMSHPAQRVYREALAFSVLALSPPIQEAVLARLSPFTG